MSIIFANFQVFYRITALFCYMIHVIGVTKLNTNGIKYNIPTIQLILLCALMEIPSCFILILLYFYGVQYINKSISCILSAVTGLICFLSWIIPTGEENNSVFKKCIILM